MPPRVGSGSLGSSRGNGTEYGTARAAPEQSCYSQSRTVQVQRPATQCTVTASPRLQLPYDFHVPNLAGNDALYLLWDGTQAQSLTAITDVDAMNANGLVPIITSGNLDADPSLDATFHLQAGSVLIDNGTALEAPPNDFDGDARPLGAEVDIGPDEYVAPVPTP